MMPPVKYLECDGRRVALRLFRPPERITPPRARVLFVHGWTGAQDANDVRLARVLARDGFLCLSFDLGGHGLSDGQLHDFTLEDFLAQTRAAYDWLADADDSGCPIAVCGCSLGGYLSILLSRERPVSALSLRVPANYPDGIFAAPPVGQYIESGASRAWRSAPRSPAENRALAALRDFRGPVQLIAAGRDESIPLQTIRNFVAAAEPARLDYHLLEEATHTLYEIPAMGKLSFRLLRNWLLGLWPDR
jgi:hypothetical protein